MGGFFVCKRGYRGRETASLRENRNPTTIAIGDGGGILSYAGARCASRGQSAARRTAWTTKRTERPPAV